MPSDLRATGGSPASKVKDESEGNVGEEKSSKISYEKLLQVARTFKAKSKRLEQEVEELKGTDVSTGAAGGAGDTAFSGVGLRRFVDPDGTLFWDTIASNSLFQQRLARTAIQRLVDNVIKLSVADFVYPGGQSEWLRKAFVQWKHRTIYLRWQSTEQVNQEQQKAIKELEVKHAKLKVLLARTHNASKQQMEDSHASRKAQTAAVEELREKEQEKSVLEEQLQALDMQNAFKQDIEMYIQKAAEELLLARKEVQDGGGSGNDVTAKTESNEAVSFHEDQVTDMRKSLFEATAKIEKKETVINELRDSEERLRLSLEQTISNTSKTKSRMSSLEAQVADIQNKLESEELLRKEIEFELAVTLKNQGSIVASSKEQDKAKQLKFEGESSAQIEQLRSLCERNERKIIAAQHALDASTETLNEMKKANAILKRDNSEVINLRGQMVKLRRSIQALTTRNKDEKSSGGTTACLETMAISKLVQRMQVMSRQKKSIQHAFVSTIQTLLDITMDNIARSVPSSITASDSPDYARILEKLETKVNQAERDLRVVTIYEEKHPSSRDLLAANLSNEQRRCSRFKNACSLFFGVKDMKESLLHQPDLESVGEDEDTEQLILDVTSKMGLGTPTHPTTTTTDVVVPGESMDIYEGTDDILNIQTLSCESFILRAQHDQRIVLPFSVYKVPFRLSWILEMPGENQSMLDVGFAILEKLQDNSTPSLQPYKRVRGIDRGSVVVDQGTTHSSATSIVVVFDNTYSIVRQKSIKYSFKVEELGAPVVDNGRILNAAGGADEEESQSEGETSLEDMSRVVSLMKESYRFSLELIREQQNGP